MHWIIIVKGPAVYRPVSSTGVTRAYRLINGFTITVFKSLIKSYIG